MITVQFLEICFKNLDYIVINFRIVTYLRKESFLQNLETFFMLGKAERLINKTYQRFIFLILEEGGQVQKIWSRNFL